MKSKIFLFSIIFLALGFNFLFTQAKINKGQGIPKGMSLSINSFYKIEIPRTDFGKIYSTTTVFSEDFESGIGSWSISGGLWEVGAPTSGPNNAHSGTNVAATSLSGNYPDNADAFLISPDINLPSSGIITLKFYHWYQTESGYDYCYFMISTDGGANWQTLRTYNGYSGGWILENLNLSSFAGRTVKLGFRFTSDYSITYAGWYIDDILIEVSTPGIPFNAFKLTSDPSDDIQPAWSPDGSTIAFVSNRIGGQDGHDLFAINPDGTNERLLAKFTVTDPWGGRFGFPNWLGNTGDIVMMDYKYFHEVMRFYLSSALANQALPVTRNVWDGDSDYIQRLLFVPGGLGAYPTVANDTSKIAWVALIDNWAYTPPEQRRWQIRFYIGSLDTFIGNTDNAGTLILQTDPGGVIETWSRTIAFSPDAQKLAAAVCFSGWYTQGKRKDLYIVDLTNNSLQRLTTTGDQGWDIASIAWSSQDWIAFSMRQSDTSSYDLYLIRPDGTGLTRLTDTPWNEIDPSWSPDGGKIVFAADKDGNYDLYIMDITPSQAGNINLYFDQINSTNFPNIDCYVTVVDSAGNPVSGLTNSNFSVFENNILQSPITVIPLGTAQAPISVALVIDRSGSMSGQPISDAKTAASSFVDNMNPNDRAAVISFSTDVTVDQSFTSDKNALKNAIGSISAGGNTAIYNAAFTALSLLSAETNQRKAVILLTDGADNSSTITPDSVIRYANQLGIPIHTIGLGLSPGSSEEQALIYLSQSTGGRYYYSPTSSQLTELYNLISVQLQAQYKISYTTSNPAYDNTIRTVKVIVNYLSSSDTAIRAYRSPGTGNWSIKISAYSDSLSDVDNFAGVNLNASDSLDLYDVPEPPAPVNNFLQLYFPHPEWGHILGPLYSKDIRYARALKNRTIEWYFEVNTDILNRQITIQVTPDSLFPGDYLIVLEDLDAGVKTIINESNTYTYNSGTGGIRRFKLVVGKIFTSRVFPSGWNLAGVPLNLDSTNTGAFITDDVTSPFYIYRYTPYAGYRLNDRFDPGRGFWLGLVSGGEIDFYGSYFNDTLEISLDKYWNIISPPYLSDVPKGSILIERGGVRVSLDSAVSLGWVTDVFYGYNGSSYLFADTLRAWEGYWFASLVDSAKLVFVPLSGAVSPKILSSDLVVSNRNWRIYLGVESDRGVFDKLAFFGVSDGASDSLDLRYDYPKPPEPPGGVPSVQIYFYHPEWGFALGPYFATDIRQPFTSVKSWKLYVKNNSNIGSEVKLTWDIAEAPSGFDLILKDVTASVTVDMRREGSYSFNAGANEVREFRFDAITYAGGTDEICLLYTSDAADE